MESPATANEMITLAVILRLTHASEDAAQACGRAVPEEQDVRNAAVRLLVQAEQEIADMETLLRLYVDSARELSAVLHHPFKANRSKTVMDLMRLAIQKLEGKN